MTEKFRKHSIEINDLIGDAINNALSRRNQVIDSQDALSTLSNEEAAKIAGGQIIDPIIIGLRIATYEEEK